MMKNVWLVKQNKQHNWGKWDYSLKVGVMFKNIQRRTPTLTSYMGRREALSTRTILKGNLLLFC